MASPDFSDLVLAIATGAIDIVEELLNSGEVLVNSVDRRGHSPLSIAAAYGRADIVALLLNRSANVNQKIRLTGMTPLHIAAANGFTDIVQILIDNGADKRIRDDTGASAFDHAETSPQLFDSDNVPVERRESADDRLIRMKQDCLRLLACFYFVLFCLHCYFSRCVL
jgi:ankyrin repeat protein